MIELRSITKKFAHKGRIVTALSDVSLKVDAGKIFGIIGSSGAGKSTLIRSVNLLERPDSGTVIVNGQDLLSFTRAELNLARRHIGMIFQQFNLLASRTVFENIAFPLELDKTSKEEIESRVSELLLLVGLEAKRNDYPNSLSGGQKQRVAIARALAANPKVLLCDEATSALDPATTASILQLLKDINRRFQITILLITHEMDVVKAVCHAVGIISEGRLIEQGPVASVLSNPQSEIARVFINSTLEVDIPEAYEKKISVTPSLYGHTLVRLFFNGDSSNEPVLSHITREFDVDSNIISGRLDHIGNMKFGVCLVELRGEPSNKKKALNYLTEHKVSTEVIGYVC